MYNKALWVWENKYANIPAWREIVGPTPNIERWINTLLARPAVQKGLKVNSW